jgi:hypothetical protein
MRSRRAKLTTQLDYTIDHRRLVADHHVVIDQLKWGQRRTARRR